MTTTMAAHGTKRAAITAAMPATPAASSLANGTSSVHSLPGGNGAQPHSNGSGDEQQLAVKRHRSEPSLPAAAAAAATAVTAHAAAAGAGVAAPYLNGHPATILTLETTATDRVASPRAAAAAPPLAVPALFAPNAATPASATAPTVAPALASAPAGVTPAVAPPIGTAMAAAGAPTTAAGAAGAAGTNGVVATPKKKRMVKRKKRRASTDGAAAAAAAARPRWHSARQTQPDTFEPSNHFYPRVLNANIHPMVHTFMHLGNARIVQRYCHLNPKTNEERLMRLLSTRPTHFHWSGADLFNVTNVHGKRQMIVIETNSCPSGQKSMPGINEDTADGYHMFMRGTFLTLLEQHKDKDGVSTLPAGGLAVIYDKNPMEALGYAAGLADVAKEPVWTAEFHEDDKEPPVKWVDEVMMVRDEHKVWHPIRATFRYVTQRPWSRIPLASRTLIVNPVVACLAGGRNKMAADKAYEFFNHENGVHNLSIRCPDTIRDVGKAEIPMWVKSMGGLACIKVPYSNAGQGVFTVVNPLDLKKFMDSPQHYDKYIVQSLVGNSSWTQGAGQYFHTGCLPNKSGATYVADIRMMIRGDATGFAPVAVYARRARSPLTKHLNNTEESWGMLGTNLSIKNEKGEWDIENNRLLLMDLKDFNRLGIAIDDLIDAYVQTVLATTAIDLMCQRLMVAGSFNWALYASLNDDAALIKEIMRPAAVSSSSSASSSSSSSSSPSSSSSSASTSSASAESCLSPCLTCAATAASAASSLPPALALASSSLSSLSPAVSVPPSSSPSFSSSSSSSSSSLSSTPSAASAVMVPVPAPVRAPALLAPCAVAHASLASSSFPVPSLLSSPSSMPRM